MGSDCRCHFCNVFSELRGIKGHSVRKLNSTGRITGFLCSQANHSYNLCGQPQSCSPNLTPEPVWEPGWYGGWPALRESKSLLRKIKLCPFCRFQKGHSLFIEFPERDPFKRSIGQCIVSKLANEIFDFLKLGWSFLVAEKRYLKCTQHTFVVYTIDINCEKLSL